MTGETNLQTLLQTLRPEHCPGDFVFCTIAAAQLNSLAEIVSIFKEPEGFTVVVKKEIADQARLSYTFVASWIMLTVHSSLEAVGLTAAFSKALADQGISCNVIAAFYHDHIFVNKKDTAAAMHILNGLSG